LDKEVKRAICQNYYNLIMSNSKESAVDKLNAWRRDIQDKKK